MCVCSSDGVMATTSYPRFTSPYRQDSARCDQGKVRKLHCRRKWQRLGYRRRPERCMNSESEPGSASTPTPEESVRGSFLPVSNKRRNKITYPCEAVTGIVRGFGGRRE